MEQREMQEFLLSDILERDEDASLTLRRKGDRVTVCSQRISAISVPPERIGSRQENQRLLETINSACHDADAEEQLLHQKKRCYHRKRIKDNEPW